MSEQREQRQWVQINRAPVLTLWASVVAERLGFRRDEALSLGRAVAGLNAYSKGRSLGMFKPSKKTVKAKREQLSDSTPLRMDLLGRAVPVVRTRRGLRAVSKGKPISEKTVQRYLDGKFGDSLGAVRAAMRMLAGAYRPDALSDRAYVLYEAFRPAVAAGRKGWGQTGRLSLTRIRNMAHESGAP